MSAEKDLGTSVNQVVWYLQLLVWGLFLQMLSCSLAELLHARRCPDISTEEPSFIIRHCHKGNCDNLNLIENILYSAP